MVIVVIVAVEGVAAASVLGTLDVKDTPARALGAGAGGQYPLGLWHELFVENVD